jgi:hypothetical protein
MQSLTAPYRHLPALPTRTEPRHTNLLMCVLHRTATARKRLAVPFRAAHLPSERSEYAQPDTALSLTTLAYYLDGLSQQQLLDALRVLLRLGQNAQRAGYSEWLQLAAGEIPAGAFLILKGRGL